MEDPGMDREAWQWLAVQALPDTGPAVMNRLLGRFDTPTGILNTPITMLLEAGLPPTAAACINILQHEGERSEPGSRAVAGIALLRRMGARLLCRGDPDYPRLLSEIHQPPPMLYTLGAIGALDRPMMAIVGSRKATGAGREVAAQLAVHLCAADFGIVSGLAIGIDASAHEGALAGGGATIAVTGVGIDRVYPRRHSALQQRLLDSGGLVLSEFPLGTAPEARNFPRRNRIISGLCLGVIVVEAALRSGSLITARLAMEQGRDVFAVPGSVRNAQSRGCHALIKDGACLIESSEDVLADLTGFRSHSLRVQGSEPERSTPAGLSSEAAALWRALEDAPADIEELAARTGLQAATLLSAITDLELLGQVEFRGGSYSRP